MATPDWNSLLFAIAHRFVGVTEAAGATSNPQVLAMLKLDNPFVKDDEVAWCSAFVNYVAWLLGLPRSKSLAARSWLLVGQQVALVDAKFGDVVILKRGDGQQPGPEVIKAQGHVGFYSGHDSQIVRVLGGNQGDKVSTAPFKTANILGIRRLA